MLTPTSSAKKRKARSATIENGTEKSSTVTPGTTIQVALRVRPFTENEDQDSALRVNEKQVVVANGGDEVVFGFTYVFGMDSSLGTVFKEAVSTLVPQALDGYNVCIMAYGQTGSGKTYCMSGNSVDLGMIPRFCMVLFDAASKRKDRDEKFAVSFYEIYQEKAYDLLSTSHSPLRVRGGDDVFLQDLTVCEVHCFEELETLRRTAWTKRATEATAMNRCSSRSHAFMQLTYSYLEMDLKGLGDYVNRVTSNIYFVDLAGSERLSEVGYTYLDETVSINSSLSALHRVIFSAGSKLKPSYRDSLLTRLLKDCLGGNARTVLVANVTPAVAQRSETLSTLRFASQAATVRQCAVKNIDPVLTALRDLKQENSALKKRIQELESSQKLVTFDSPTAPSIVEFQPDPSLTTWEPLIHELSFSAYDCDSSVVVFTLVEEVIQILAREEGVFVNGEYLYPNIPSTVMHGDHIVVRGERIFFVYAVEDGHEKFLKCSYHSLKAEYLEKNMDRFRAEVSELEKVRRKAETDIVSQSLVDQIESLKAELANKENEKDIGVIREREALQVELDNCMMLKETFLDLCKREISAFGVKIDSFPELLDLYSLKRDVEVANYTLNHFNKDTLYAFELILPETEQDTIIVRLIDRKNKMIGDLDRVDFDWVLRRLKEYYQEYTLPEKGSEIVGQLMFKLCRRKLQMSRIGGTRMSNFVKAALYNSTVDAAKRRRTTLNEFRLSIGCTKRKSTFTSSFAVALGDIPEYDNSIKSQFLCRLIEMTSSREPKQVGDFVEAMCSNIVELKTQLLDARAIQRGAIREGIGFYSVLNKFGDLVSRIDGSVKTALGFSHSLNVDYCLKSVHSAWTSFVEFFNSWVSMMNEIESESTFEEVGPLCLDGMVEAIRAVVLALGRMSLYVGGKLYQDAKFHEIKEDFVLGSKQALSEIRDEAEDVLSRLRGKRALLSEIAVGEKSEEEQIYSIISPLFAVLQQISSKVTDPIEYLVMERECVRGSYIQLKSVAEVSSIMPGALAQVKDAIATCERTLGEETLDRASIASIFSDL